MPKKAPEKIGSVLRVPLSQLHPHPQNPFAVRDDSAMQELKESVSQNGVLVPAIARPRAEGGYELIAGHRRKYACEQAGQDSMPVIVLNLNDDEAVIQLVDSNIQREDILPSERARAYKMKMDAIKRQGARTDLTSSNGSAKFRSDDLIGERDGVSGDTVRNYISLNNLTPPLMQMVDEKKIALTPAYQLAALSEQEQELLVETMSSEQATPSLSQAQRMKKLSQIGELNEDTLLSIMMEQKKPVKAFFEAHREEIILHKAAKNAFQRMGMTKLPKVKELSEEYATVLEQKKSLYAQYRLSREEMREYQKALHNTEVFFDMDRNSEIDYHLKEELTKAQTQK